MEREASHSGQRLSELSKEELEQLWEAAKAKARAQISVGIRIMKSRKRGKPAEPRASAEETRDGILIRPCHGIEEFEACIRVEREVWKSADVDIVPIPLFVVAVGDRRAGSWRLSRHGSRGIHPCHCRLARPQAVSSFPHDGRPGGYRDRGIGRRLKLFQREDALSRGIGLVEWTFDPLVTKNAYFNFMRLGAIARRYLPNAYGITTSPLHASLPTDRLVAEWHLRSDRVRPRSRREAAQSLRSQRKRCESRFPPISKS